MGEIIVNLLLGAGILAVSNALFQVASFFLVYLRPSKLHRYRHATAGKPAWALVTGSSAGIGKAYAYELASHGFNVALHGRSATKLANVSDELAAAFPNCSFKTIVADASQCATDGIVSALQGLNLTVLINNAGGREIMDNVNLNAMFPTLLLSRLLPTLVSNGPSLVINMGSMSDNGKAFGRILCQTLANDMALEYHAVEVMCVQTGGVTGTSHIQMKPDLFNPDTRTFARAALARVGCGRAVVVGYFPHAMQQVMADMMPGIVKVKVFINVMKKRREDERERMKNN
ncbi:short chain dehydrogenase/reductase [Ilyonectria destructans]|nr:short chain dehydrogenase/reductase [Ilyonectria destructans]